MVLLLLLLKGSLSKNLNRNKEIAQYQEFEGKCPINTMHFYRGVVQISVSSLGNCDT